MSGLSEAMAAGAARRGDQPAVICPDGRLSYAELGTEVPRLAAAVRRATTGATPHVGLVLANRRAFVAMLLAAVRGGFVVVPLDPEAPPATLAHNLDHCDAGLAVVEAQSASQLVGPIGLACAATDPVLIDRSAGTATPLAELPAGDVTALPASEAVPADAPLILTTTSGSTGMPKPIVLGQDTKYARARAAIATYGVTAADTVLAATPLYHSLAQRHVFVALVAGATAVIMDRFAPEAWCRTVAAYGASFTIPVSAQLIQLLPYFADPQWQQLLASLRCVVASSAPLPVAAKDSLLAHTTFAFHECYGTSELGVATDLDVRARPDRRHTVGAPVAGVAVAIADGTGQAVPPGTVGEICCHSALQCHGYYKAPEADRALFRDGYFYTGDLGYLEPDGYLVYRGRQKFVINMGGAQVFPEDVEAAIAETPGVAVCAAFGLPHATLGEEVALAFVPTATDGATPRRVRRSCLETLAPRQQPRRIFQVESLPRNSLGKLQRARLPDWVTAT